MINGIVTFEGQELDVNDRDGGEQYSGTRTTWYTVLYCTL